MNLPFPPVEDLDNVSAWLDQEIYPGLLGKTLRSEMEQSNYRGLRWVADEYQRCRLYGMGHEETKQRLFGLVWNASHPANDQRPVPPVPPCPFVSGPEESIGRDPQGRLRVIGQRALGDDQGARPLLTATRMNAIWLMRDQPALLETDCRYAKSHGVDALRILGNVDWPGRAFSINPMNILDTIALLWSHRLRTQLCLFGALHMDGLMSQSERRIQVKRVARAIRDSGMSNAVAFVDLVNEPGHHLVGPIEPADLQQLAADFRSNCPGVLISLGAPYHPSVGETLWADENRGIDAWEQFEVNADLCTPHYDRGGDANRQARQPYHATKYGFCTHNDEPIGPGSSGSGQSDPRTLRLHATSTWLQGNAGYCWHTDAGVGYQGALQTLSSAPGLVGLAAIRPILEQHGMLDIANFNVQNWHWTANPFESLNGAADSNGTGYGAVRTHALLGSGERVVIHAIGIPIKARYRMRRTLHLMRYDQTETGYAPQGKEEQYLGGEIVEVPAAHEYVWVGRFA